MHLSSLQKLQAVLTAAKTTNDMPVVVEWIDISPTALPSYQTTPTNTNGLTIVDIVAAPTTIIQRKIAALSVTNRDTATKTVEIYLDNNGTDYLLVSCQLSVGDMLGYSDTRGWYAQDQFGCEKTTVQLAYSVVITALGFTPENVANKSTDIALGTSDTLYPTQNAVRTFVNNVAGGTSLDFFLSDTVSDIATYYTLLNNPSPDAESNVAVAITTSPTTIKTFATISTEPSITSLISGAYTFHIHAAQTAGTKTSTIYANFYTRTSGGAETLRATSESSIPLTAISTGYDLNFTIPTDISINSTDRIVLEILGVPAGVGTTPTITIYMEGTTASRIEFRTTSAANDTRYLVKNGLSGGQIAIGGLDSGDDLLLKSTSHATKGYVGFGNLTTGFIYDEANNRIGFGVIPLNFLHVVLPSTDNMYIDGRTNPRDITLGVVRIDHTANIPGTRPLNIDIICAGHADTHAVNVDYHATGIVAGDDSHVYDVHVDTSNSTGGLVAALAVGKSGSGTVTVRALETYHGVSVLEQRAGTLTAIEQAWTYTGAYTDVTTAFGSAATDVQIFVSNNDYIYIGMAGTFDDIEVILATVASGAGIKPVFQYSAGAGIWTTFTPVDGSNGFRTNGNISWTLPLAGWATDTVNAVTKYWVRIQRTQVTLVTPPTEDTIKVFSSTYYHWDENGDVVAKSFTGLLTGSTGLPISTGVSGLGTGVATALAVNIGTAGAVIANGGALGTPSSGTLTNCTGLPAAGVTGTALVASAIGTTVQAYDADLTTWAGVTPGTGVATALAVNVGTVGSVVVNGGVLGTPLSGTLTNCTGLPAAGVVGTALVSSAIGTTVQAYDADLTTWAGVTPGIGVATALAVNVGTAGAIVVNGGALGTPLSGVATNLTGTATGLTAGNATVAATVTVADAAADTTTWPMLATSQTGNLAPATDAGLTYDASTNALTSGEIVTNGSTGGIDIANSNSTEIYQERIGGTMTFDSSSLNALLLNTTMTGGATTTTMRTLSIASIFTPTANADIQSILSNPTLNSGASPTNFYGQSNTLTLGASALGGTITTAYGHQVGFSANASATTNITTFYSFRAGNIADGAAQTVSTAVGFSSAMNTAAGTRWGFLHSGTADNAFNGNTRFGGVTAPTVAVDVTGAIQASTTIKTGGYTVATLPAGSTGMRAYVTDATAPTWLGALTGGGAVVCPVFKNATVWVSA